MKVSWHPDETSGQVIREILNSIIGWGMKFTFKGGTSLLLLLPNPKRLSTDIDSVVDPDTDVADVDLTQDDLKQMKALRRLRTNGYEYLVLADRLLAEYRDNRQTVGVVIRSGLMHL